MSSTNVSEFNPILSGTATPEGMKQRLEDARQQLLLHYENVKKPTSLEDTQLKILSRLESMEDIHNVIDSVWSELINIHDTIKLYTVGLGLTGINKQRREENERKEKHFYDTTTIGGVKCSEFQKGNVVLPEPMFINGIRQGPDAGIQCVIFDKIYYNDEKAREWLRYNGFKTNYEPMILCNPHITEDYFSYMQFDVQPKNLQRDIFTSITPKKGIELLIYCKK